MQETHSQSNCPECGLPLPNPSDGWGCPACSLRLALSSDTPPKKDDTTSPPPGFRSRFFADYEILSEIARGGMGVVYRARQLGLNRMVALKMVQSQHLLSDEARLRFRVEIEAVAQLHHPHIVSLYESGEHEGAHFFTMRLVEGGDLGEFLRKDPPLRTTIQLLVKVCRAVHYAHQRGILHRDLKPSNILVDEQGEPHVADFGLAKSVDQDSGFTFTSSVLGSPNYMAPEQASGNVRQLTTAVDVYGLGAILYHALAHRPPFQAGTPIETLRQVVDRDPAAPRNFNPGVDPDLETIALKCLRKEQNSRYGSAEELALDLERWLNHQPILARPLTPWESFTRWSRRHPALLFLGTALSLALLTLAIGSFAASWRINQANQRTQALVTRMQIQRAESFFSEGESAKGLAMLAYVLRREPDHPAAALRLSSALHHRRYALLLSTNHFNPQSATPTGATLNSTGTWVTLSASGNIQRWNLLSGKPVHPSPPLTKPLRWSTVSSDHLQLLVGYLDGTVELRQGLDFSSIHPLPALPDGAAALRISPSGRFAAVASVRLGTPYQADMQIWDTQSLQTNNPPRSHSSLITDIQFTPDEKHVLTVCSDGRIRFWPLQHFASSPSLVITQSSVLIARFDPSQRWMAVGEYEGGIKVWDTHDFTQPKWSFQHEGRINDLSFSSQGDFLISASVDDTARIWNLAKGSPQTLPLRHGNIVNSARFSPDDSLVVTASNDNTARLWDASTGTPITEELPHQANLNFASFTPDGQRIMTTTFHGDLALWELRDPDLPTHHIHFNSAIHQIRFSPDSSQLALGNAQGKLRMINPQTASKQWEIDTGNGINAIAFTPNGQLLSVGGTDRVLLILNTTNGQPILPPLTQDYPIDHLEFSSNGLHLLILQQVRIRVLDLHKTNYLGDPITHSGFIDSARWSPDGQTVITTSRDRTVRLWSALSGKQVGNTLLEGEYPTYAEFSPNGRRILVSTRSGKTFLFAADSRNALPVTLEHRAGVTRAAFSPQGSLLATASEDQSVKIWDASLGDPLLQTLQHRSRVESVEFSSDGQKVLTLTADGFVRIWDVSTGLLVADPLTLRGASFACFSPDNRRIAVSSALGTVLIRELPPGQKENVSTLVERAEQVARQRFVPPDQFKPL